MKNIDNFIHLVTGIHDSPISHLKWNNSDKTLVVGVDDLYANFEGTEEYLGSYRCEFTFYNVLNFEISAVLSEVDISVYDWKVESISTDSVMNKIRLSPGGEIKITCERIEFNKTCT